MQIYIFLATTHLSFVVSVSTHFYQLVRSGEHQQNSLHAYLYVVCHPLISHSDTN